MNQLEQRDLKNGMGLIVSNLPQYSESLTEKE